MREAGQSHPYRVPADAFLRQPGRQDHAAVCGAPVVIKFRQSAAARCNQEAATGLHPRRQPARGGLRQFCHISQNNDIIFPKGLYCSRTA